MRAYNNIPAGSNNERVRANYDIGYPLYPANDDIYNRAKKEMDMPFRRNVGFDMIDACIPGGDLIVPGSGLDDRDEEIGSEDEENIYYSIGGDNHDNLEEHDGD